MWRFHSAEYTLFYACIFSGIVGLLGRFTLVYHKRFSNFSKGKRIHFLNRKIRLV